MKRLYLAGPMTGYYNFNVDAFHDEAKRLRSLGYDVYNPAETTLQPEASWLDYMRVAIKGLVDCDAVVTLPGWEQSRGASIEVRLASELGLAVWPAECLR